MSPYFNPVVIMSGSRIEKLGIGIRRVYPEDCQLCISGYTGKKCRYLKRIGREYYCVKDAVKEFDNRLIF